MFYRCSSVGGNGGGVIYTAGEGIDINGTEISVESSVINGASAGATAVQPADLATVATTGAYSDLSGTPTIPTIDQTYNSESTNAQSGVAIAGAGFLTTSDADASTITTNASNKLQTVAIVNQNTESGAVSPLKLWNGTEAEWEAGGSISTPLYAWKSSSIIGTLGTQYVYTLSATPQVNDYVYRQNGNVTIYKIVEISSNNIEVRASSIIYRCNRDSTSDTSYITPATVGEAYPDWLCNINGVGVKIGTTLIADNTNTSSFQTKENLVTSLSNASTDTQYPSAKCVYDLIGDVETLLSQV